MPTNLLIALNNLIKYKNNDMRAIYKGSNRANIMGEALEYYVKDLFCDSIRVQDAGKKDETHSKYFSYIGNQNNPPDFMIKSGDSVEVKKIQSFTSGLALNSSYPKSKLYSDSPMITTACRHCEEWQQKDIIYSVGVLKEHKVKLLWFIYGDCYAADREVYDKIKKKITEGMSEIKTLELSNTNELGRINKVDPLGITYLRIRGMWGIDNPLKVFDYVVKDYNKQEGFNAYAIIQKDKYDSFPKDDRAKLEASSGKHATLTDVKIKDPNNPANYLPVKLIKITF